MIYFMRNQVKDYPQGKIMRPWVISPSVLIRVLIIVGCFLFQAPAHAEQTSLYVDLSHTAGPWEGTASEPYQSIQEAVNHASDGYTIHIAEGTYLENVVISNLAITLTGTDPDDPNIIADTIIDGRKLGSVITLNDANSTIEGLTITNGLAENGGALYSHNSSPIIRLCIIRDNKADTDDERSRGGGIYNDSGNPVIIDTDFKRNRIGKLHDYDLYGYGGAFYNEAGRVIFARCSFEYHHAGEYFGYGGALYNYEGTIALTDCSFQYNRTTGSDAYGGAVFNDRGNTVIVNCSFIENECDGWSGGSGGAIYSGDLGTLTITNSSFLNNNSISGQLYGEGGAVYSGGDLTIKDSLFQENMAHAQLMEEASGGAVRAEGPSTVITNTDFIGNFCYVRESGYGGALYCSGDPILQNCLFAENTCSKGTLSGTENNLLGGGLYVTGNPTLVNCTIYGNKTYNQVTPPVGAGIYCTGTATLLNCILWANSVNDQVVQAAQIQGDFADISYSCIQDWTHGGVGNINDDPLFADPNHLDFHLKSHYGRWDPKQPAWMYDAQTSACIDGGKHTDPNWINEIWPHGKRINMGVYGGTPQASLSASKIGNIADLNKDDRVDIVDFIDWLGEWTRMEPLLKADMNRTLAVDNADFTVLSNNWLWEDPLVSYWRLDEPNEYVSAWDSTFHYHEGVLINDPVRMNGRFQRALHFNGDNTAVEIPTTGMNPNEGSLSMWVNADGFNDSRHFIFGHAVVDTSWSNRIQLYTDQTGELALGLGDQTCCQAHIHTLRPEQWYHLVLTWNGSEYAVYVNSQIKAQGYYTGLTTLNEYADIGNNGNPSARIESFNGIIDDVRVYSRPLADDAVNRLYLENLDIVFNEARAFIANQLTTTADSISPTAYPRYTESYSTWNTSGSWYWGSGFRESVASTRRRRAVCVRRRIPRRRAFGIRTCRH